MGDTTNRKLEVILQRRIIRFSFNHFHTTIFSCSGLSPSNDTLASQMLGRLLPLFGSDSFLNDLSEAGLPRMTSTALRWTPKRHPFTCPQHPTHQNNPTNGSKVRRGSIFSSSALPHFQPIRCSKRRTNLLSEGVSIFYGQK